MLCLHPLTSSPPPITKSPKTAIVGKGTIII